MKFPFNNLVPGSAPSEPKLPLEDVSIVDNPEEEKVLTAESASQGSWCPPWLLKPFQFASLAVLTQIVLLLNQIALLPIQIRIWGTTETAYWYSILAVAAIAGTADLGLRSAGHAELMRHMHDPGDVEARLEFRQVWSWIRILIATTTFLLVAADFCYNHLYLGDAYPLWRAALVIGLALEILLTIRIGYLDSQGLYREAEGGYLILAAARLALAVGGLLLFDASPAVLGWIWFFTGVFAIIQQNRLCKRNGLLHLFEPFPSKLSFKTLSIVRLTMADPCSGWVRINGPVVILSIISQPIAIITYVALRGIFGASRTTVLQVSRYASVEYLSFRQAHKNDVAEIHLTLCVLGTAFFSSVVAAVVIADNGRLASLLLHKVDLGVYQEIAITFGLGSAFYAYQITQAVSRRAGEVAEVSHRQYAYILCAALFAGIALIFKSTLVWLILMLLADIIVSLTFLLKPWRNGILANTTAGLRGSIAATASSIILLAMWWVSRFEGFDFMMGHDLVSALLTIAFFLPWVLLIAAVNLSLVYGLSTKNSILKNVWSEWRGVPVAKVENE